MRTFEIRHRFNSIKTTRPANDRNAAVEAFASVLGDGDPGAILSTGLSAREVADVLIGDAERSTEKETVQGAWTVTAREDVNPDRPTYRERREARLEKRQTWAEGRGAKADTARRTARSTLDQIPLGQPILVGHHSERRHRRDLDRVDRQARKAREHSEMKQRHEQAAATIAHQLDTSIYDDDADAIEQLKARIAEREAKRERIKRFNRSCRKGTPDLSELNEKERHDLATTARVAPFQIGPKGQAPGYWLSNLGGNINRDKKRLATLEAKPAEGR